jgi:hypothetical protein
MNIGYTAPLGKWPPVRIRRSVERYPRRRLCIPDGMQVGHGRTPSTERGNGNCVWRNAMRRNDRKAGYEV